MNWQPIETAPKLDQQDVLLWVDGDVVIGYFKYISDAWIEQSGASYIRPDPTHWMPLPEPPTP